MTAQAITMPFHGTNLFIVDHNGQPYTPMKPIAEGMGLSWQGQHEKLSANPARWGIKKILIPTLGDMQEAICLPLRKLAGWLATISPNKVRTEIREKVIIYQNECDDALWNYWTKGQAIRQPAPAPIHYPLTRPELAKVRERVACVDRYFRFHSSSAVAAAIYAPLFQRFGISRMEHLNALDLPLALDILQRMHDDAHAYYLEGCRRERSAMAALYSSAGLPLPHLAAGQMELSA